MSVVESLDKTHYFTVANAFFPLVFPVNHSNPCGIFVIPAENSWKKSPVLPHRNNATLLLFCLQICRSFQCSHFYYVFKCKTSLFTQTLIWHLETSSWVNTKKTVADNGICWIQILLEVFFNSSHPDANLWNWNESDAFPWSNSYWFRDFLYSNQLAEGIPWRQERNK